MPDAREAGVVFVLRHGETVGGARYRGVTDDPLSAEGRAQMTRAVERCGEFDRIVTSPLRRCADFARALAEERGVPLVIESRFREMHFGLWEGKTVRELTARCPQALRQFWADPLKHPPPGGEPVDAFCTRVVAGWQAQVEPLLGGRLLLIVHGGTARAILGYLRGLSPQELVCLSVPCGSVHQVNAGVDGCPVEVEPTASGFP